MQRPKRVYEIDGLDFATLDEFYDIVGRVLIPGASWGRNLNAFNDILRGGFGTPDEGFVLLWKNSQLSRERLGYEETIRQLEHRLARCHSDNAQLVNAELRLAREGVGYTVFEWLTEIIADHGAHGSQSEDGVDLVLD